MKKKILVGMLLMSLTSFGAEKVWIVPKSKVYHTDRDCSTLSRSKNVQEVTKASVKDRRECKKC